jgi:hypothetical protein
VSTLRLAPARRQLAVRRFVVIVVLAVVVLRLLFLFEPLHPDEAGYLLVAQDWHRGGTGLYGHYWVDRPPGLIALFKLASLVGWLPAIRLLALPFVALFIVSAAWAAHQVAGVRGARWSAVVAAALMVSPFVGALKADGELFAASFVMLGVALTIAAVYRTAGPSYRLAFLAGLAGGLAVAMKQDFGDALVFATTLVLVSLRQGRMRPRPAYGVLAAGAAGALVVVGLMVAYSVWDRVGVGRLWYDLYGFRSAVFHVILSHDLFGHDGPAFRALELASLALLSGIVPVLVALLREAWRCDFTGPPIAWGVGVTVIVELLSIVAGGGYWSHYLLGLAPMVAFAIGLWGAGVRLLEGLGAFTVGSALLALLVFATGGLAPPNAGRQVGAWLHTVSRPADTATMLYGIQDAQLASGLRSPYPYLWPLPLRTLDPHEALLRAQLTGARAPTWVVVWSGLDQWRLDPQDRTRLDLATHYDFARRVCGHGVWLRDGVHRGVSAPIRCG